MVIWVRDWSSAAVAVFCWFITCHLLLHMIVSIAGIPRPLDVGLAAVAGIATGWTTGHFLVYFVKDIYQRVQPPPDVMREQRATARRVRMVLLILIATLVTVTEPINVDNSKDTIDAHGMFFVIAPWAVVGTAAFMAAWRLRHLYLSIR